MGSISAAASIERVLRLHGDEIRASLLRQYAQELENGQPSLVTDIVLSDGDYEIDVTALLVNGQELELRSISIDALAEEFPDADVSY